MIAVAGRALPKRRVALEAFLTKKPVFRPILGHCVPGRAAQADQLSEPPLAAVNPEVGIRAKKNL